MSSNAGWVCATRSLQCQSKDSALVTNRREGVTYGDPEVGKHLAQWQAHSLGQSHDSRDVARGPLRLFGLRGDPLLRPPSGPAIFRAQEHIERLLNSAKVYRIDVDYSREQLVKAMLETVASNGSWPCYVRPIILRGYGEAGVNPFNSPTEVYIINYPWGKYLGGEGEGCDACVSSWTRIAPNTLPAMAKSGANYMNSQLIKMEAIVNGFAEGIALDVNGYVSEGSGENVFIVHREKLITAPLGNSVLPGITRDSTLQIAHDLGIPVVEQMIPREMLYIADEAFFTGTAAEITAIRTVDKIKVGKGGIGPITKAIQKEFYAIVRGEKDDRHGWLTPVPVRSKQPVGV